MFQYTIQAANNVEDDQTVNLFYGIYIMNIYKVVLQLSNKIGYIFSCFTEGFVFIYFVMTIVTTSTIATTNVQRL